MHYEQWKHEHIIHNMNEKKKNQSCTSLCSPRSISQHGWSLFFRLQCQQNTSSTAPPGPAYPLESLWELHLFTKAFAWKLYKHRCTIKRGPYVTDVSPCCGPNVTFSQPWAWKVPTGRFAHAEDELSHIQYTLAYHQPSTPACSHLHRLQNAKVTIVQRDGRRLLLTRLIHNMWWYRNSSDSWGNWWN